VGFGARLWGPHPIAGPGAPWAPPASDTGDGSWDAIDSVAVGATRTGRRRCAPSWGSSGSWPAVSG